MDSAKDISKKIRNAIKAKLVELGAYVDDELPDYIMVMVANKKTESQMTDDLSLFLGDNTEKFTAWLHGLLVKLQTLSGGEETTDKDDPLPLEKKFPPDKQTQKTSKSPAEKDGKVTTKKTAAKRKHDEGKGKVANKESESGTAEKKESSKTGKDKEESSKPVVNTKQKDEEYVSELLETVEVDEFSEEFNKEQEQKEKQTKTVKKVAPTTTVTKSVQPTQAVQPQVSTVIPTRDLYYPQKKKVIKKVKKKTGTVTAKPLATGDVKKMKPTSVVGTIKQKFVEEEEEYDPLSPSYGTVASSVKVSRKKLSVPPSQQATKSLIMKATAEAQKSTTLQHVLKEEKLYSAREKATVKPIQQRLPGLRQPKIRPNIELISKSRREEMMRDMTYSVDREESPESDDLEDMKIVVQNKPKFPKVFQHTRPEKLTYTVTNKPHIVQQEISPEDVVYHVSNKSQKVQYLTSPVNYTLSNVPQTVQVVGSVPTSFVTGNQQIQYVTTLPQGQVAYTDPNEPQYIQYVKVEPQQVEMETVQSTVPTDKRKFQHVARVQPVMDSRLVRRKSEEAEEEEVEEEEEEMQGVRDEEEEMTEGEEEVEMLPDVVESDETSNEAPVSAESPDTEVQEVLVEEDDNLSLNMGEQNTIEPSPIPSPEPEPSPEPAKEEPVQRKRLIKERVPHQSKPKSANVNTRFIVTLDGVDPLTFKTDNTYNEDLEAERPEKIAVISKITPPVTTPPGITRPAITPITFSLNDTDDDEEETGESPGKKSKMAEKCKFWPACVNGNSCSYHHPTVPCKMFPSCKFGDKCLYIHPNCKFDAKCTKKDCPFTHASKRGTAPTVIKQYIPMPVPPVPSYHHRSHTNVMCKFAGKCNNMYCQFQHPTNCRYGANCSNRTSCPFSHPNSQTNNKYSWTANKSQDNSSKTDTDMSSKPS